MRGNRIQSFRPERLARINGGETMVPLQSQLVRYRDPHRATLRIRNDETQRPRQGPYAWARELRHDVREIIDLTLI